MWLLWTLLAIAYVACWIYFRMVTFRKGHLWLFWIGFLFPLLWIIGAFIGPAERAAARYDAAYNASYPTGSSRDTLSSITGPG